MSKQSSADGSLSSLLETFERPDGTDNTYETFVAAGNSLDPDFTSPDLPSVWQTKSALVTVGPDYGSAFWLKQDGAESPTGYSFSAGFIVETDGMLDGIGGGGLAGPLGGTAITLFISKPTDWSGPLAAWRVYICQEHGQLELAVVFGLDTDINNSSGAVYKVPINIHQAYDISILYDTAHRFYGWSLDGHLEVAADMPTDWPLIGNEIIGSSGSSSGRNSSYVVDNVSWVELSRSVNARDHDLVETFETPNGTDNEFEAPNGQTGPGNSLDPNFHSPNLPGSWGNKSGLITIGPGPYGGALWRAHDEGPSPNGYNFTGSFLVAIDGLRDGEAVTVFAGKVKDPEMTGTAFGWRLHLFKSQGGLQLLLVVGADTSIDSESAAAYEVPIVTDRPYGVDILYDTAHRFYSWTVNGNRQIAAKMPDDYPLIGTKVIGSSFSSSGRNTVYAVDNVKWVELSAGTPYTFFTTTGQPLNLATTSDPANPPPVVPGSYNLEELMNASGSGTPAPAPGYDGLAIMSNDTHTLFVAAGNYGLVDSTGADSIMAGLGNVSIGGAAGDTIIGGTGKYFIDGHLGNQSIVGGTAGNGTIWGGGAGDTILGDAGNVTIGGAANDTIIGGTGNYFIDGHLGNQSIVGGTTGNGTIWGGAGDTILGAAGNVTIGGAAGDTIIGGTGNYFIDGHLGNQSIVGGTAGNGTIWGGAGDTILGGAGNVTIGGVSGNTIIGGAGNTFIDAHLGNESIAAGSGNTTVWGGSGDTVQGATGTGSATIAFGAVHTAETYWDDGATSTGNDSVFNFNQAIGDRVSLNSGTDNANTVVAVATADGSGNAVLHLSDGSNITLVGVPIGQLNTSFFTTR